MNEVAQWAVLLLFGILILGLFRQISLALPPEHRSSAEGPPLESRLPRQALDVVSRRVPLFSSEGATLAFVTESCTGCQRLLADLGDLPPDVHRSLVLVVNNPTVAFGAAIEASGETAIIDRDGALWKACRITATPLVVQLSKEGRVIRKEVTHDVRRVASATGSQHR